MIGIKKKKDCFIGQHRHCHLDKCEGKKLIVCFVVLINVALKLASTVSMELKVEPDGTMNRARPVRHLMTAADRSNKIHFSQSRLPFEKI